MFPDDLRSIVKIIYASKEKTVEGLINNTDLSKVLFDGAAIPSIGNESSIHSLGILDNESTKRLSLFRSGAPKGRLAVLRETGGKLRVFAIPSAYTQLALYPLHKCLFELLSILPSDFTHDQLEFRRLLFSGKWDGYPS